MDLDNSAIGQHSFDFAWTSVLAEAERAVEDTVEALAVIAIDVITGRSPVGRITADFREGHLA